MGTTIKKIVGLLVLIFTLSVFGVAIAAQFEDNVKVTVKDKQGRKVPFATVEVNGVSQMTGSKGQPAVFDLEPGTHEITASHPLIEKHGNDLIGRAKLKLTQRKTKAKVTIKLKGKMIDDPTPPVITETTPRDQSQGGSNFTSSQAANLFVFAEDTESGIALAEAKVDDTDLGPAQEQSGTRYGWTIPPLSVGQHKILFTIWNYAGKASTTQVIIIVHPPTGTISGTVTFNNAPLVGATVSLPNNSSSPTDEQGKYELTRTSIGNHEVTITADGLGTIKKTVTVTENQITTLDVAMTDTVAPAAPTNVAVALAKPTATTQWVEWQAVTDRSTVSYEIIRLENNTQVESKKVTTTNAAFTDLKPNTSYTYRVRAIDAANNMSGWTADKSLTTQQKPTLTWSNPINNQKVSGKINLTVDYRTFGSNNNAKRIEWHNSTTLIKSTAIDSATGSQTAEWDTAGLPSGQLTLTASVIDAQDNVTRSDLTIVIDNPNQIGGRVTFGGNGVANATIKTDDNKTATTNSTGHYQMTGVGLGQRTFTVTATGFATQTKTVTVAANNNAAVDFDLVDNAGPSTPAIDTLKNINPTANTQELTWAAPTDISGIGGYEVERSVNGAVAETKSTTSTTIKFEGLTANAEQTYRIRAKDKAVTPNWSAWSVAKKLTTQKAPTVAWVTPTNGQEVKDTITVTVDYTVFTSAAKAIKVTVVEDNQTIIDQAVSATTGQVSGSWNTTNLSGNKTLRALITDNEDNQTTAEITVKTNVKPGAVDGTVTEAGSNVLLSNIIVTLKQNNTVIATGKTNNDGRYTFENIAAGTYSLTFGDEGYTDKTVTNVTVSNNQKVAVDAALTSLPRVSFNNALREIKRGDGSDFTSLIAVAVRNNSELAYFEGGSTSRLNFFNAETEVATGEKSYGGSYDMITAHKDGYMLARFGYAVWADVLGNQSEANMLSYKDLATTPDNNTILTTAHDRIFRFVNQTLTPTVGYKVSDIVGIPDQIAVSDKSIYVNAYNDSSNKLHRLSIDNPTDPTKAFSKSLGYKISEIQYVPNSRVIMVAESTAHRIHLLDSRTLDEIGSFTLPFTDEGFLTDYTIYGGPTKLKAYMIYTASDNSAANAYAIEGSYQ